MSKEALLTGTAGGIIGAITAVMGIIWSIIYVRFYMDFTNYLSIVSSLSIFLGPFAFVIQTYQASEQTLLWFSLLLAIFLIVTGILIGVGFYGTYKIGGGAMGVVGLIFGIIGGTSGALFIILGNLLTTTLFIPMPIIPFILPITMPNYPIMWIGFMVLGVTFILLGSASITVREMTMNASASQAAGILSIIGGSLFLVGALIFGGILLIGFILIFVAFILWTVVFYTSRYF